MNMSLKAEWEPFLSQGFTQFDCHSFHLCVFSKGVLSPEKKEKNTQSRSVNTTWTGVIQEICHIQKLQWFLQLSSIAWHLISSEGGLGV